MYVCIHILFHILFHYGLSQDIEYSSLVLYSRTLLFINLIYNTLHLLIPNSQSIHPLTPTFLAITSLFSVSQFLFHRCLFCRILDSMYK